MVQYSMFVLESAVKHQLTNQPSYMSYR